MPAIDLSSASPVTPPPLSGVSVEPASTVDLTGIKTATPPPLSGATATDMPPVARAGVELAKWVLSITAVSIVILTAILIASEYGAFVDSRSAYNEALTQAALAGPADADRDLLLAQLRLARLDPSWNLAPAQLDAAKSRLAAIGTDPTLTKDQSDALKQCLPIPATTATRNASLDQCISVIQQEVKSSPTDQRIKEISDLAKQAGDQQQLFRTFWMQAAQLVLLNLLLPLLTALFGYIFGTAQAQRTG